MSRPADPVAAVTHPDLLSVLTPASPAARSNGTMASGCGWPRAPPTRGAVLTSEACRVRPPAEPVPRALAGSAAGSVFGRLVRMNDGDAHAAARRGRGRARVAPAGTIVRAASRALARARIGAPGPVDEPTLRDGPRVRPARARDGRPAPASTDRGWTMPSRGPTSARGIAGAADADRIVRGRRRRPSWRACSPGRLRASHGCRERPARARRATRGGPACPSSSRTRWGSSRSRTSHRRLHRERAGDAGARSGLAVRVDQDRGLVADLRRRSCAAIRASHNTRRFVARAGAVAGAEVAEGDAILVVLARRNAIRRRTRPGRVPARSSAPPPDDVRRGAARLPRR